MCTRTRPIKNTGPTFKLFELGSALMRKITVYEEALPAMRKLSADTGECSFLNVVDKDQCLCLAKVEGHKAMQVVFLQPGGRIPLHVAAGPKVLLAHLPDEDIERILNNYEMSAMTDNTITDPKIMWEQIKQIRQKGYATSFGEENRRRRFHSLPHPDRSGNSYRRGEHNRLCQALQPSQDA